MDNVNLISILKFLKTLSKCGLILRQCELGFQPTWGKGHSHPCRPWLSTLPLLFMLFTDNSKFNRLSMFSMTDSRFNRLPRLPATRFDQFCCSIHVLESLVLKIAYNQNKILAFFFSILFCSTEFLQLKNISLVKFFTGSPTSLSRDPSKPYNLFNTYPDLRPQDTQWVEESEHHFFLRSQISRLGALNQHLHWSYSFISHVPFLLGSQFSHFSQTNILCPQKAAPR